MIHIDLSNAVPARAYNYLAALLPGLFFEVSLTLANPAFVNKVVANVPEGFPLSQYVKLGMALFLAFVIGNGFMMWITLIRWLLGGLYVLGSFLRKQFYSRLLLPVLSRFMRKPLKTGRSWPSWVVKLHRRASYISFPFDSDLRSIYRCLHALTQKLLETKYGITSEDLSREIDWRIFYVTLATPTRKEVRGETTMIATHATGWCGLAATRLAPSLNNRYYLSFSLLMIVVGLLHDFYLARSVKNPVLSGIMNIRGLLREFGKIPRTDAARPESKREHEEEIAG
jgi:hypothetical protein